MVPASAYLSLRVGPGGGDDANGKQDYSYDLYARIFFAPESPSDHGGYAPARPKDNMDGYGNIVAKGVVVERVDAEEQYDVDQPALQRDFVWTNKERGSGLVELGNVACDRHEEELDEGQ